MKNFTIGGDVFLNVEVLEKNLKKLLKEEYADYSGVKYMRELLTKIAKSSDESGSDSYEFPAYSTKSGNPETIDFAKESQCDQNDTWTYIYTF